MTNRVLLVGCGEPAIHAETEAFAAALGVEHLERVLMPGGCWWLAEAASATSGRFRRAILGEHVPVRDALVRFITYNGIKRMLLLGHQGCSWYAQNHPDLTEGQRLKQAGSDMFAARDELQRIGPEGLRLEGYIHMTTGELPGFRQLFPASG